MAQGQGDIQWNRRSGERQHYLALALPGRHQAVATPKPGIPARPHFATEAWRALDLYSQTVGRKTLEKAGFRDTRR